MSKSKKLSDLGKPFFFFKSVCLLVYLLCLSTCLPVYLFVYPSVCQVLSPSDDSAILNIHTNLKLWKRLNIYCDLRARQLIIVYERLNDNRMNFFFFSLTFRTIILAAPDHTHPWDVRAESIVKLRSIAGHTVGVFCKDAGIRRRNTAAGSVQEREKRWQPTSQNTSPEICVVSNTSNPSPRN